MKVEIHSHVVIRFSSKTRAHDHFCFILIDIVIYIYDIDKKTNHSNLWNSTLYSEQKDLGNSPASLGIYYGARGLA